MTRTAAHAHAWVAVPLLVFGFSRLVGWILISIGSHRQVELAAQHNDPLFIFRGMPADPGYLGVITNWDGQWYQSIAIDGYQIPSPEDPARDRLLWTWGFPPGFPFTVRAVMLLTHTSYAVAATIVSVIAGAIGMILLYRLLRESGGSYLAVAGVALASFFVSAPLFQAAYSESLAFMLVMGFLTLLRGRRYVWAIPIVILLSLTRIITLPLAFVVAVHAWQRLRARNAEDPFRRSDVMTLSILAAVCVLGSVAWLLLSSLFLGAQQGMARSEAQRNLYLGWFTDTLEYGGVSALVVLVGLVLIVLLYSVSRLSRGWGSDLRAWSVAYPVYILAISPIMPGTLRYLLLAPTLPMMLIGSPTRPTVPRVALLVLLCGVSIVGQWWLVSDLLVVSSLDQRFSP